MKKRQKKKLNKNKEIMFALKVDLFKELKEDSIAHLVKDYFTMNNVRNMELFKYDKDSKKILVSKKALNHILKLCGSTLLEHEYDFELVDEIKILKNSN